MSGETALASGESSYQSIFSANIFGHYQSSKTNPKNVIEPVTLRTGQRHCITNLKRTLKTKVEPNNLQIQRVSIDGSFCYKIDSYKVVTHSKVCAAGGSSYKHNPA